MKKMIEKMILETINNTGSIMPLFKTGYAYSQVLNWCNELEKEGLICRNEDDIRILSVSGIQKLNEYQPASIGQASRISGVSPADVSVLLVYLNR